jgi:hypothetical protein
MAAGPRGHAGRPAVLRDQPAHCGAPTRHRNLGVTSIHLQGIDPNEIIETVHGRDTR